MKNQKEILGSVLIADLSGFTALTETHGSYSSADIVMKFKDIINRSLQPECHLIDQVGDEAMIFSQSVDNILRTAIDLRSSIHEQENFLDIHIGIHFGNVLHYGDRIFGIVINAASRIASYAGGGQILCSSDVKDQVLEQHFFTDLGEVHFRNVSNFIRLFSIKPESYLTLKVIDPVCRMKVDPNHAVAHVKLEHSDYYFCSSECHQTFMNGKAR